MAHHAPPPRSDDNRATPPRSGSPEPARRARHALTGLAVAALLTTATVAVLNPLNPPDAALAVAATCTSTLTGWAAVPGNGVPTTTGGGRAAAQTVTNLADLQKYAGDATPRVLRISGTISTGSYAVDVASNKTIIGADRNATVYGGLNIRSGSSNIIIQNLNLHGTWPNSGPDDTLAARGAHHLWFDHLNVWDSTDGLLDVTLGSDNITVSWSKFWYTNSSHPHRLASLVSSGADHDDTDAGKLNATYHHNWFAERVDQRMPRILFGKGHVYNNYYTATDNGYGVGVGALASVLIENNYFSKTHNPHQFMYTRPSYITAKGNVYDNTSGTRSTGAGGTGGGVTPFTSPPYSYVPDSAGSVPGLVSGCAGPTLSGTPTPPTTSPTTSPTTPPTTSPTVPPATGACTAGYRTVSTWDGGWQGEVTVTAGRSAISGWTVTWKLGSGQSISQVWNGQLSTNGTTVSVRNVDYNGSLAASATTTFGLIGAGTATTPSLTCTSP